MYYCYMEKTQKETSCVQRDVDQREREEKDRPARRVEFACAGAREARPSSLILSEV